MTKVKLRRLNQGVTRRDEDSKKKDSFEVIKKIQNKAKRLGTHLR